MDDIARSIEEGYSPGRLLLRAAVAVTLLGSLSSPVLAQQSQNYSMDRVSVTAVGQTVASPNFETTVVAGQESPAGAASFCNTGFVSSFGFWSVTGNLPVPIHLTTDKNPADPSVVELLWTGADPGFQVFRSSSPDDVLNPANLYMETSACADTDPNSGAADLLFYKVVATPTD